MNDPLRALLELARAANLFPPNSRYHRTETATFDQPDGQKVLYLRRRFIPQPGRFALVEEHIVQQGERLDNIAAQRLGDPELFWQVCDANAALRPDELTQVPGRRLRITQPADIAGAPRA